MYSQKKQFANQLVSVLDRRIIGKQMLFLYLNKYITKHSTQN